MNVQHENTVLGKGPNNIFKKNSPCNIRYFILNVQNKIVMSTINILFFIFKYHRRLTIAYHFLYYSYYTFECAKSGYKLTRSIASALLKTKPEPVEELDEWLIV